MQHVLVTGGAGFIGSHLCKRLLENDFFVYCIDNLLSGSKSNIGPLLQNPKFIFLEQDVTKPLDEKFLSKITFTHIFHLASPASPNANSPRSYMAFPIETFLVNTYGTYQMLQLASQHKAKLLFASTSEVYGDPDVSPQSESYYGNVNSVGPRAIYDESKRAGEAITMAYVRKFNLDARIVRIFNTYGPLMQVDDGRVVSNFINQAIKNVPITIYGDGKQTRSFCYVTDTVEGLWKLMFQDNLKGQVVNIGNPIEKTIVEFASIIIKLTSSKSEIVYEDLPIDDPKQRKPDITRAKHLLNFEPTVALEEGLLKTIEYFKTFSA